MSDAIRLIVGGPNNESLLEIEGLLLNERKILRSQKNYHHADALLQQAEAIRPSQNRNVTLGGRLPLTDQFTKLLQQAQVIDVGYPVAGNYVWLPYGVVYRRLVIESMVAELAKRGYEEYLFPSLIATKEFTSLSTRVFPFDKKVFRVSGGDQEFILKPTGETAIYPMFRKWLRDGMQLPLRVFQVGPYFRPRHHPSPYLQAPEATAMIEAHSAYESADDMNRGFGQALEICRSWMRSLSLATLELVRPSWTNRPVSLETVGFDLILPWGKTSQTAVAYRQGQIFSKAFDVRFLRDDNWAYTYQITFGITERNFITALLLHSDVLGLRIPPTFAPYQVIFIVVSTNAMEMAERLAGSFQNKGIRTYVEQTTKSQNVFLKWIVHGAPLQIILDDETVVSGTVVVVNRSTMLRSSASVESLLDRIFRLLEQVETQLLYEQDKWLSSAIHPASSAEFTASEGPVSTWLCIREDCVRSVEANRNGEVIGFRQDESRGYCVVCRKPNASRAFFSRRI